MDYDATTMHAVYDAGRSYSPEALQFWLGTISAAIGQVQIDRILDLGCGTGRYSAALAAHFEASVVAVDPSEKMLSEARKKGGDSLHFLRGSAESVPLADGAADLVFISMAFHHFDDPEKGARECFRVLRKGGVLCLRAATSDRIGLYPYVPFFPGARRLMGDILPTAAFVKCTFEGAGFDPAQHQLINGKVARTWRLFAEKIAHRADSCLALLTDEEFSKGLAALEDFARNAGSTGPVIEPIDLFVFRRS